MILVIPDILFGFTTVIWVHFPPLVLVIYGVSDLSAISFAFHASLTDVVQTAFATALTSSAIADEVKAVANAVWTTSVKDAWKAKLIADKSETP